MELTPEQIVQVKLLAEQRAQEALEAILAAGLTPNATLMCEMAERQANIDAQAFADAQIVAAQAQAQVEPAKNWFQRTFGK